MTSHGDDQDVIDVLTTDHRERTGLIGQITSTADPEQRRDLADHMTGEQAQQFPQLRAHVSQADLVQLEGEVETAKEVAPTRPHPNAPDAELFHKTVGPGVGLVDRLGDTLAGRST